MKERTSKLHTYSIGPDFNEEQYVAEVANELLWGLEGLVEED